MRRRRVSIWSSTLKPSAVADAPREAGLVHAGRAVVLLLLRVHVHRTRNLLPDGALRLLLHEVHVPHGLGKALDGLRHVAERGRRRRTAATRRAVLARARARSRSGKGRRRRRLRLRLRLRSRLRRLNVRATLLWALGVGPKAVACPQCRAGVLRALAADRLCPVANVNLKHSAKVAWVREGGVDMREDKKHLTRTTPTTETSVLAHLAESASQAHWPPADGARPVQGRAQPP